MNNELKGLDLDDPFSQRLREYEDRFGESFPTFPLLTYHGEKWCMDVMRQCIDEGKTVYQLGYIEEPAEYKLI